MRRNKDNLLDTRDEWLILNFFPAFCNQENDFFLKLPYLES
jgi:hypothetical protein